MAAFAPDRLRLMQPSTAPRSETPPSVQEVDLWSLGSFLAFRYVAERGRGFTKDWVPRWPDIEDAQVPVSGDVDELEQVLRSLVEQSCPAGKSAVFLSAGIDSAILAALLPRDTPAYCIRFRAPGALDESPGAQRVAEAVGMQLEVVDIQWEDYERYLPSLMRHKRAPLHPVEVGLHVAALRARERGAEHIVVGNGADSTFGGMDKLLSKDWTFEEFVRRYTFIDPASVLSSPVDYRRIYEPYRRDPGIDVEGFLKRVHGIGIVQAFDNALHAADCTAVAPYESLRLTTPLDLEAIRSGNSKPALRALYRRLLPGLEVPEKIPFARPMDRWMRNYRSHRGELSNTDVERLSGEQRFLVYCLERFLDLVDLDRAGEDR